MKDENRFRECREKTVYSQKQVAMMIGVKPPQISKWESGASSPSRENCVKLSKLYNVSVDYLLGNEAEKEPIPEAALDSRLIEMLMNLSPSEVQRVIDFVSGMKATGKA